MSIGDPYSMGVYYLCCAVLIRTSLDCNVEAYNPHFDCFIIPESLEYPLNFFSVFSRHSL